MASPKLAVLDVGHGNCAVLRDRGGSIVFDAGIGSTLEEYLATNGITEIVALLISHADADHLGGAIGLLLSTACSIKTVYLNPDASKGTEMFRNFRIALEDAR